MKKILILSTLALAPTLWAAEPSVPGVTAPVGQGISTNALISQQELAEQAALVQQIGEQAAKGFDAQAHARSLRAAIEALVAKPVGVVKPAAELAAAAEPPSTSAKAPETAALRPESTRPVPFAAVVAPAPAPESLRQVIRKLRAAVEELENQVDRHPATP